VLWGKLHVAVPSPVAIPGEALVIVKGPQADRALARRVSGLAVFLQFFCRLLYKKATFLFEFP
jgi:hypothetical protein